MRSKNIGLEMEKIMVGKIGIYFEAEDRSTAELISKTCTQAAGIIQKHWGWMVPSDLRIYVMRSWKRFYVHATPWYLKIFMFVLYPFWSGRVESIWQKAGGWSQRFGRRMTVGIKPAELLQTSDRRIGEKIFVKVDDWSEKVTHILCHEMTHAFSAALHLPLWLNEGLAMVTVDHFFRKTTVRRETLDFLSGQAEQKDYRNLRFSDKEAVITSYARSYWLTRYLEEKFPSKLRELLAKRTPRRLLKKKVAELLGISGRPWISQVDGVVKTYYQQKTGDK